MNKKLFYSVYKTINDNNLLNYNRFYDNHQRMHNIPNNVRDTNLTEVHQQTENFDKYYNTRYIEFTRILKDNDIYEYDEDDYDF